jgi:Bacterial dipeptidyl-peptidase Sh3 domain/NlpC/P60 family
VEGDWREVIEAQAPMRRAPSHDAVLETEALMGERVKVYETSEEGWAWGQLESDGYVGYLPATALAMPGPPPTHRVAVLRTLLFPGPSIYLSPVATPSLGARLTLVRQDEPLAATRYGRYVPSRHVWPDHQHERDFVAVAERFLGVPYLWGGKTSLGVDCSGLTQVALAACGIGAPRDSDLQQQALGATIVPAPDFGNLARGDLVFFKSHVAIVRDRETLLHANAYHMAVTVEPIQAVIARVRACHGGEVTAIKRLIAEPE